jgi:hypothetical protein
MEAEAKYWRDKWLECKRYIGMLEKLVFGKKKKKRVKKNNGKAKA